MQKLKMNSWNILENSRIWKNKMPPIDRITLLVLAPNEED
jgi:hypothetical protein